MLEAVAAAGWTGIVLPRCSVLGVSVFPVVELLPAAFVRAGPVLDRSLLSADGPGRPLRIVGAVSDAPWRRAVSGVVRLRAYGAGLIVRTSALSAFQAAEADVLGLSVVVGESLVVQGDRGPVASARRTVATRHREELLFGVGLRSGLVLAPHGALASA